MLAAPVSPHQCTWGARGGKESGAGPPEMLGNGSPTASARSRKAVGCTEMPQGI